MEALKIEALLQILRRRWWVVTAAAILFTFISAGITFYIITPVYKANTTLYVYKNQPSVNQSDVSYNDLLANTQMVKDYRELVKSRQVADMVKERLGLDYITSEDFSAKLTVSNKNDTRVIQITATDNNPEMAAKIADMVAEVFQEKAVSIMQVNNVQIIDTARTPDKPFKPDKKVNLMLGFIFGAMASFGVLVLIEYLDNTVKTPEDIQKYIGVPVIGTIPVFTDKN